MSSPTDTTPVAEPGGEPPFRQLSEELVHQGAVVAFCRGEFEGPDGERFDRDIVRHPGAVAIVAIDGDDVFLVRQYRASLNAEIWELPAGKMDVDGEPPIETAKRELEEEIGMRAGSIEPLLKIHHSPGFCDEVGHLFLASDLTAVPVRREGPEEQLMQTAKVPLDEAIAMVTDGRVSDIKTIAAILATARRLGR